METNSPCIEHLGGNTYRCRNHGWVIRTDTLPIHCACSQPPQPVDAAQWFTAYYTHQNLTSPPLAEILAKLERCRSADCDLLKHDVCTMQGKTDCKRRSLWFGNLTGTAACKHWRPVGRMSNVD